MTPASIAVRGLLIDNFHVNAVECGLCGLVHVTISAEVLHRESGTRGPLRRGEHLPIPEWKLMSPRARAQHVFNECLELLKHELAECFFVNGARVFDPHKESTL